MRPTSRIPTNSANSMGNTIANSTIDCARITKNLYFGEEIFMVINFIYPESYSMVNNKKNRLEKKSVSLLLARDYVHSNKSGFCDQISSRGLRIPYNAIKFSNLTKR